MPEEWPEKALRKRRPVRVAWIKNKEIVFTWYECLGGYAIYNPTQYDKKQEKSFEDNGELQPFVSSVLDYFLNGLTIQDMFLQIQNERVEKEKKLEEYRRKAEKESNQKNEKLRELIENDEIKVVKVIKGRSIGNGRSAAILQLNGDLDASKFYIAK